MRQTGKIDYSELLTSPIAKLAIGLSAFVGLAYLYGFWSSRSATIKVCSIDPKDLSQLPNGGTGLSTGGTGDAGEFTEQDAQKLAKEAYGVYETYNPLKPGKDALANKLLALNDDQFAYVARYYASAYSSTLYDDIKDDYFGWTNWQDEMLDTPTWKVVKRLERLKLD